MKSHYLCCTCTIAYLQGLIQGPIFISGGDSPNVPRLGDPLMLPHEINPDAFRIPDGYEEPDDTNSYVKEELQVDTVIFNNLDIRGTLPTVGVLSEGLFEGMNMARDVFVLTDGPFHGIAFEDIEIMTFNLGDGVDSITVENSE